MPSEPEEKPMTLDELLLQKLAKWRPDSGRQTLDVQDPASGWAVAVTAGQVEALGCCLWELALRNDRGAPNADLRSRADQVAARATGLLEPLTLLEVDTARNVALLRSEAPGQWGAGRFYYEVLLEGGGTTSVRRYQAPGPEEPRRQQVPFTLTHEALAKLVRDLTG
jgi:hypothetical protein